uniref:Uncharacterized protein n=1 Tax=Oryza punctata TaxID=4537 RepID=A0A0E0MJJ9_ORYPU
MGSTKEMMKRVGGRKRRLPNREPVNELSYQAGYMKEKNLLRLGSWGRSAQWAPGLPEIKTDGGAQAAELRALLAILRHRTSSLSQAPAIPCPAARRPPLVGSAGGKGENMNNTNIIVFRKREARRKMKPQPSD